MLTKEEILDRTSGGLDFYKFVIPSLQVNGSRCRNVLNPFYEDTKPSLSIFERDGQWFFKDFGNEAYSGDVFDFAGFYYGLSPQSDFYEILRRINKDLNLGLSEDTMQQQQNDVKSIIRRLKNSDRSLATAYLRSRKITRAKDYYLLDGNDRFPPSVVFANHNRTGFEKRFIADENDLKLRSLPKTMFYGQKSGSVYIGAYIPENEEVYICEGVINALSFYELGKSAIATFGATNMPDEKVLERLISGKKVYLAGDGDEQGKKFNQRIKQIIKQHKIAVRQVYEVIFPEGHDANSLLVLGSSPLEAPVIPAIDVRFEADVSFPVPVFPYELQAVVEEAHEALHFPIDYLAASILFAISVAVGNVARLHIKTGWQESALLYLILVGRPGANKSYPLSFAVEPLFRINQELLDEYVRKMQDYKDMQELADGDKPSVPMPKLKQILVSDVTIEALHHAHLNNPRGLGLYRDEILAWLNEFNRYRKGSDLQFWLSNWNNKPVIVNRKNSDPIYLQRPFISVAGTIQTNVLAELNKDNMDKNGFVDRILFVFPSDQRKPYFQEQDLEPEYLNIYHNFIRKLYELDRYIEYGQEYIQVNLSPVSKELFKYWQKENTDLINSDGLSDLIRSIYSKLDIYILRLALILHLAHWAFDGRDLDIICQDIMEKAVELVEYFRLMALKANSYIHQEQKPDVKSRVLELHSQGLSYRKIAQELGISKSTVGNILKRV